MKPYEEIDFPNGFLRWIREDGMYSCSLTEEQMAKIKAIHEAPRTWVGLTKEERHEISMANKPYVADIMAAHEEELKRRNT
jgi:hypothetical protein